MKIGPGNLRGAFASVLLASIVFLLLGCSLEQDTTLGSNTPANLSPTSSPTLSTTEGAVTQPPDFADPRGTVDTNLRIAPPYQEIRAIGDAGGAQWWDLYPRLKGMQVKDWSGWVIAPSYWPSNLDGLTFVSVDMDDPSTPEGKLGIPEVDLAFKSPIDLTQLYDHRKIRFSGTIDNPTDATNIPMKDPQIWLLSR